jgi:hypothetical protein
MVLLTTFRLPAGRAANHDDGTSQCSQPRQCSIAVVAPDQAGPRPELGIAIEVDSREWHLSPEDHANTLARGRRMARYQIVILRFTPAQLRSEPAAVIRDIKAALEGARGRPPLDLRTVST